MRARSTTCGFDDQNLIGAADRRQPWAMNERRASCAAGAGRPGSSVALAVEVEVARRGSGCAAERSPARSTRALPPAAQLHTAFADDRVVALWELRDNSSQCATRHASTILAAGAGPRVADVLGNRASNRKLPAAPTRAARDTRPAQADEIAAVDENAPCVGRLNAMTGRSACSCRSARATRAVSCRRPLRTRRLQHRWPGLSRPHAVECTVPMSAPTSAPGRLLHLSDISSTSRMRSKPAKPR